MGVLAATSMTIHGIAVKPGVVVNNIILEAGDICGTDVQCIDAAAQHDMLQINHYNIKSLEYYTWTKMHRGEARDENLDNACNCAYFEAYDRAGSKIVDLDLYYKHQDLFDSLWTMLVQNGPFCTGYNVHTSLSC